MRPEDAQQQADETFRERTKGLRKQTPEQKAELDQLMEASAAKSGEQPSGAASTSRPARTEIDWIAEDYGVSRERAAELIEAFGG